MASCLETLGMDPASPPPGSVAIPDRGMVTIATPATIMIMDGESGSPFGERLRQWRQRRGLSQLALAGLVGSTARHISFLETGRSRPGHNMTIRLATALDVGLRESNQLLRAAGLKPLSREARIASADPAPYRLALDRLLAAHDPYPAMALDRHWNVVLANRCATVLFGDVVGSNFVRDAVTNPASAAMIANWPEVVAWAGVDRLRQQAQREPFDAELRELVREAEAALYEVERPSSAGDLSVPWTVIWPVASATPRPIGKPAALAAALRHRSNP
jgi:transcriptional regulator with XRE-family HTH domain